MMQNTLPNYDLAVTTLEISLRALEPIVLPPFAGSKFHGAFGEALYEIACTRRDLTQCQPCPLRHICPFAALYQPMLPPQLEVDSLEKPPTPLVFLTPLLEREQRLQRGNGFGFGLRVFGRAIAHLPYIVAAIERMGAIGIGKTGGRFELQSVTSVQPFAGQSRTLRTPEHPVLVLEPLVVNAADLAPISDKIVLRLETFMHLRAAGRVVSQLHPQILIRSLQRRLSNLEQIYGAGSSAGANFTLLPHLAKDIQVLEQRTVFASQKRSGKGKQPVVMNGVVGYVRLAGNLGPFAGLLRYGELVGVGKWAHFGAGQYRLERSIE
ncbi:MAG: CRISPR system precrRNA processing endoribonuclease RAMP protein Cas6 [Deinococcales bacterium]